MTSVAGTSDQYRAMAKLFKDFRRREMELQKRIVDCWPDQQEISDPDAQVQAALLALKRLGLHPDVGEERHLEVVVDERRNVGRSPCMGDVRRVIKQPLVNFDAEAPELRHSATPR